MRGVIQGGLFEAPQPFPQTTGSGRRSSSGSSSDGGSNKLFDFDKIEPPKDDKIDRKVSGTDRKTAEYYALVNDYDMQTNQFHTKYQTLFSAVHGGNNASFMAMEGEQMTKDMMLLDLTRNQLSEWAGIIKDEQKEIETSTTQKHPDMVQYDMNGEMITYKGADGNQHPVTNRAYMELINQYGFVQDKATGNYIKFEDYQDVTPTEYDRIMAKHIGQVKDMSYKAGMVDGIVTLNAEMVNLAIENAQKEIMANPEARRYYLRQFHSQFDGLSTLLDGELVNTIVESDKRVDQLKKSLNTPDPRKRANYQAMLAEEQAANNYLNQEKLKRQGKANNKWNDADEIRMKSNQVSGYNKAWRVMNANPNLDFYWDHLSEAQRNRQKKENAMQQIREGSMPKGREVLIPIRNKEVDIEVMAVDNLDEYINKEKFIESAGVAIGDFAMKYGYATDNTFSYKIPGETETKQYSVFGFGPKAVDNLLNEIPYNKEITKGSLLGFADVYRFTPNDFAYDVKSDFGNTYSIDEAAQYMDAVYIMEKTNNGSEGRLVQVPIQNLLQVKELGIDPDIYFDSEFYSGEKTIFNKTTMPKKQKVNVVDISEPTQSNTVAAGGALVTKGSINIVPATPNSDGVFRNTIPVNAIAVQVKAYGDGFNQFPESKGRAYLYRFLVPKDEMDNYLIPGDEKLTTGTDAYPKNQLSRKENSDGTGFHYEPADLLLVEAYANMSPQIRSAMEKMGASEWFFVEFWSNDDQLLNTKEYFEEPVENEVDFSQKDTSAPKR